MPDVVYHGWTHRPKAQGGTDPIEFPAGSMPFAYGYVSGFDAEDETEYSLLAGDDGGFAGNATGCAEAIYIGNDPGQDVFYVINNETDNNQCLALRGDANGLYSIDATVLFAGGFDGDISIYPDSDFALWTNTIPPYDSPASWPAKEWRVITSADNHDASVRFSSTVYLRPNGTALNDMFSVIFQQVSGGTQTVQQAWCLVTRLSQIDSLASAVYPAT